MISNVAVFIPWLRKLMLFEVSSTILRSYERVLLVAPRWFDNGAHLVWRLLRSEVSSSRDKMSGRDSSRNESMIICAPGYFNQADIARQGDSTLYLHIKIIGALRRITEWLPFPGQKQLVKELVCDSLMSDTRCSRGCLDHWLISARRTGKSLSKKIRFLAIFIAPRAALITSSLCFLSPDFFPATRI